MKYIVIGIHGLSNKPQKEILSEGWHDAMCEGLLKNEGIDLRDINFESIYWADVMYKKPDADPDLYSPADEGTLKTYKEGWSDWVRKYVSNLGDDIFSIIQDKFGFVKVHEIILKSKLKDLHNYYTNETKRIKLRTLFKNAVLQHKDKRIMVVAHSMGSIVAYDVLRELGRKDFPISIDHFITIGSPLGLPYVQHMAKKDSPLIRTPSIVKKWTNMADRRDPVAIDTHLNGDYEPNDSGVEVKDDLVFNDWGGINHKSYGYLRTPEFSQILARFI